MKKIIALSFLLGALAGLGIIAVLAAVQQTEPPVAIKAMIVPACAFCLTDQDTVEYGCDGARLWIKSGGTRFLRAPLYLPHNSKIIDIVLWCKDNDPNDDITMWVHKVDNYMTSSGPICTISSTGADNEWIGWDTDSFTDPVVDNYHECLFVNLKLKESADEKLVFGHVTVYYKGNM
jgi:hypothetical protein